ncbi:hypothetical protein E5676_scaffold119G001360 [Cucumis melo var. makuwa]|uniref:Uncharacterized protein n=1 Tax=Cucumis melo var. makuwa TaxID=1194695 RepID=A0A5D3D4X8_CUCMM|nr:hypothetical protein E6C27_scaffold548G001870 [Cucumis melo var. makuwa]TYK18605.1 hypothetical protein E5676_scaffold119G001360 [Cucumis melo var. makuwa]
MRKWVGFRSGPERVRWTRSTVKRTQGGDGPDWALGRVKNQMRNTGMSSVRSLGQVDCEKGGRVKRLVVKGVMNQVGGLDLGSEGQFRSNLSNLFRANERVRPLVQGLDSVLKRTTYLLTLKRVEVNSVLHPISLDIHPVLPLKWEAYWPAPLSCPHLCKSKDNSI